MIARSTTDKVTAATLLQMADEYEEQARLLEAQETPVIIIKPE